MTLCPIALVSGCVKCPMFSVCPLKAIIGNYQTQDDDKTSPSIRAADVPEKQDKGERKRSWRACIVGRSG